MGVQVGSPFLDPDTQHRNDAPSLEHPLQGHRLAQAAHGIEVVAGGDIDQFKRPLGP